MKRVLYISNIEVPYRVQFFNELAQHCDLTVLYERNHSRHRDKKWTQSIQKSYQVEYLNGFRLGSDNALSLKIFKYVEDEYDAVIIGCVNSPVQVLAMIYMKLRGIPYCLNVDGEIYLEGSGLKNWLKRKVLKGASRYLAAGKRAAESLQKIVADAPIISYYFSSLTEAEIQSHKEMRQNRNDTVLVIGQYFDYKGMDVAVKAARMDPSIRYKFVGMGARTELFRKECMTDELPNVEIIPFLQKEDLNGEYQQCAMLVLPSRQECWGLVVNEAASFGMPIVSTWGSGAAVEFLAEEYSDLLAKPNDARSLLDAIHNAKSMSDIEVYGKYLMDMNSQYSIERCVQDHLTIIQDD